MTKTREFWYSTIIAVETAVIVSFLACLFLPSHHGDAISPVVSLKKIHDLAAEAKQKGKPFTKTDVERTISELQKDSFWLGNTEVLGTQDHWLFLLIIPRPDQNKFQRLTLGSRKWPVYILSADDDGWTEISPLGKISHSDFNW